MDKVGNGAARRRCTGMGQHGKVKYGDITVKSRPEPVLQAAFRHRGARAGKWAKQQAPERIVAE
jgi:hypothetical protein